MNQNYFLLIVFALFLLIFWGNMKYRKAVKSLSPDKQIDLTELQRSFQLWTIGLVIGMMALFFVLQKFTQLPFSALAAIFVVMIMFVYIFFGYKTYNRMKALEFERSFLVSYLTSNGIRLLAILLLLMFVLIKELVIGK